MVYSDFPFILKRKELPGIRNRVAKRLSNLAVKHFNMSFDREGFVDKTFQAWQPSQRALRGEGRTLTRTGALRRSIRSVKTTYPNSKIVSDLQYSARHNDGEGGATQRQFMGRSEVLDKASIKIMFEEFDKILL